jgi:hypothetical protein
MSCPCLIPVPNYPDTAEWGPLVWTVLHGLAEKSGSASIPADEVREWVKFLKFTGEMLPCDKCRAHYATYLANNPITLLSTIPYDQVHTFITTWLWTLHNEINADTGKPFFPYTDLPLTYSSVNLQDTLWRLEPVIKKAIQLNGVSLLKWAKWLYSCKMLKAIVGM